MRRIFFIIAVAAVVFIVWSTISTPSRTVIRVPKTTPTIIIQRVDGSIMPTDVPPEPTEIPTPTPTPRAVPVSGVIEGVAYQVTAKQHLMEVIHLQPEMYNFGINLGNTTLIYTATADLLAGWENARIDYEKIDEKHLLVRVNAPAQIFSIDSTPNQDSFSVSQNGVATFLPPEWFNAQNIAELQTQAQIAARPVFLKAACEQPDSKTGKLLIDVARESLQQTIMNTLRQSPYDWQDNEVTFDISDVMSCEDPVHR